MRAWPSGLAQWLEKRQRGSSSLEVRERALRANPQAAAGPELTASALRRARLHVQPRAGGRGLLSWHVFH